MDPIKGSGGSQQVPPADDSKENENTPPETQHKPQTNVGRRLQGMSLKERMAARKGGITTTDGGPSVRPTNSAPASDEGNADTESND